MLLGRLHPLLVHLPIGILLLAVAFEWLSHRRASLRAATDLMFQIGAGAAVAACLSGWLLASGGEYAGDTLDRHRWLGIGTATLALAVCFFKKRLIISTLLALVLTATGHFGGTLTHGADFLTVSPQAEKAAIRPADIQQARVYADLVAPILREKCVACHGDTKQKGGLRLDSEAAIAQGGKNGPVLRPSASGGGPLLERCMLPLEHKDHMPPKEKPQLAAAELELLKWWIAQGADFQRKVSELPQPPAVQAALATLGGGAENARAELRWPTTTTEPAPEAAVQWLRQAGVVVRPIAQGNNWLSVSFVNLPQPPDSVFVWLEKIAPQVVALNLNHCQIVERAWASVGKALNVRRLDAENSSISDAALAHLRPLRQLQSLNLARTSASANGLKNLAGLPELRRIFIYQTQIERTEYAGLAAIFPQAAIDTGGYVLPLLAGDTVRLTKPLER
jgi:uncharacterized membrane protein